jgi:tryptophan-rich sensory protein
VNRLPSAWIAALGVVACAVVGGANGPQQPRAAAWYLRLRKPDYTPPGPAIGATWGVLEALLLASGYRLLRARSSPARTVALGGWGLTLLGLAGFPWLFFRERRLTASTLAAGAMLASAATTAIAARDVDAQAAKLTTPLIAWLTFATILSEELLRKNQSRSRD